MSARESIENLWGRATPVGPLLDAYRAELTAEFVAWLVKKAREHRAKGPQYAKQADVIGRLADKASRGAVRPNNLLMLPAQGGPEDVPALLAEVDRLRARVAELGALPMPTGEPMPVELTGQQLEALSNAGNRALNDHYHEDLCSCWSWPTSCESSGGYFMGTWDTAAFDIGLPAVLGVWESLRNDRHAAKIAELRADNERLRAENERLGNDLIGANLALWEDAREIARLLLALKAAQRGRRVLRARLKAFEALELGTPEGRVSAKCEDATHPVWLRDLDDMRGCPWCRVAELEALTPAPIQTCRSCGAGYDYGKPCSVCEFKKLMADAHPSRPSPMAPDPLAYGPTGYRCGCGKDAHSNLTPCQPMTADEWNAQHPVGTPVTAYPVTRDDEALVTVTRSRAWTLGHGAAVVAVDGYSGGICLTHVDPRSS